jgi:sigma-B regulation protein RsbU (phosphoserine phosphatase)
MIWRKNGQTDDLSSNGLPLGMLDDSDYSEGSVEPLQAGDVCVLFTDGIPDVQAPPHHEPWGLDNMRQVVVEFAAAGAQAVCDAVVAAAETALRGHPPHDDMTIVVIERLP